MARFFHQCDTFTRRRFHYAALAFSWVIGLGFGALTFGYGKDSLVSLMPSALSSRLSIVGLLSSTLLPFLFSVFAVYISVPQVLIVICLAKAFLYAYISCGVYQAFGSAGWLAHWILMFTDTLSIPVLYLFWLRHVSGCRRFRAGGTGLYLVLLLLIAITGHFFLAPLFGVLSF